MPNIKDIAKAAGVSVATVSRVLNTPEKVVPETRERIAQIIEEMNYNPNMIGRNLRRSETRLVMVTNPDARNPLFADIIQGIERVALQEGYGVMVANIHGSTAVEEMWTEWARKKLVDGLIIMSPSMSVHAWDKLAESFPVIQCCEAMIGSAIPMVSTDDEQAGYAVTRYLTACGHRRIAIVGGSSEISSTWRRMDGYRRALREAGIWNDPAMERPGNFSYENGQVLAGELLCLEEPPTAVFAMSDMGALGVIRRAQDSGLRVPEDLSVVGFDGVAYGAVHRPALTTVVQNSGEIGATAMQCLLKQIREGIRAPQETLLDFRLVVRESSGECRT